MKSHKTRPTAVWILPPGLTGKPRKISMEEIRKVFRHYSGEGFQPNLEWLYQQIGCSMVDFRDIKEIGHLWFDEEGLLKPEPTLNLMATMLYQQVFDRENVIVGKAVLVVDPDASEEDADLYVSSTVEILQQVHSKQAGV